MDQRSNAGECIKSLLLFTTESQNDKGRIASSQPRTKSRDKKSKQVTVVCIEVEDKLIQQVLTKQTTIYLLL